jgi:hypothetical protein
MLPEVLKRRSEGELVAQTDKYDCASLRNPGNLGLCTFHQCNGSSSGSNLGMASYASSSALICCSGDRTG